MAEPRRAEVLVVGAGPAGIAAACGAAEAGAEVLLIDEAAVVGGQIWRGGERSRPAARARRWGARLARSGARLVASTTVLDAPESGRLTAERQGRCFEIEAERLVLATGARELFLPFPGWTLPGVVGVGAVQALLESGASFRGQRVVVAGSGPLLLPAAAALAADGARLGLVAEQAGAGAVLRFALGLWRLPSKLLAALAYRLRFAATRYRTGTWVAAARGDERVRRVELTDGQRRWIEECDLLCAAYGLEPNTELARLLGCEVTAAGVVVDEALQTTRPGVFAAGEATGVGGADLAVVEGEIAGLAAGGANRTAAASLRRRRARLRRFAESLARAFRPRPELGERLEPATTVCRCEDVAWGHLDPRWNVRQAKLYTRLGMGPCQGRVCGPAVRVLLGWGADSVRPPLRPCVLAGLCREAPANRAGG